VHCCIPRELRQEFVDNRAEFDGESIRTLENFNSSLLDEVSTVNIFQRNTRVDYKNIADESSPMYARRDTITLGYIGS
jgi:hypothetical protein